MPVRRPPHIGQHVRVVFLGATVPGVIDEIDEQERRLLVLTEEGEKITFRAQPRHRTVHRRRQSNRRAPRVPRSPIGRAGWVGGWTCHDDIAG